MGTKILIADDENDIVSMLGSFFESKGFRVLPALNGAEALKQVEKQPDIILLDINMPGTDGLEVCKRIRDHISCPILFLTARIEDTDKVKGFTVGGDDYIVKPFSLMELEARVRAHLRREARHNFEAPRLTIQNVACSLAISVSVLQKRNLILWNCFLKIQDRSLIKNGYMSVFGVMTARATAALWQSISAGYGLKLLHIPTIYMLKRFGGVDTNGSSKLPQALFISPNKPCSLYNCLCCTRSLSIRNDFFDLW